MFHMKQTIISVVNQKGGVGKTTTSLNVATCLAVTKKKTLLIDFDPQSNLSSGLGYRNQEKSIYNLLIEKNKNIKDYIIKTKVDNLDIIPSNIDLSAFETDIFTQKDREFFLKNKLDNISEEYDYIIIDCPPSLGFLTINALSASDKVLIPMQCEFFSLEGISYLLETLDRIKTNFNSKLSILGVLFTMYDKRNKITTQIENDVRSCLGDFVFNTIIPRNVKLTESTSFGVPAIIYDQNCSGSIAYINLTKEIIKKL